MKSFIFLFVIVMLCSASSFAQQSKTAAMPAEVAGWQGEGSDKILENAVIKARLKKLLGAKNYAAFMESFETLTPIEKNGDVLFSSGCLIHACGHLESAIAINIAANTIHAAIYRETEKTKYFNDRNSKTPEIITSWASRLGKIEGSKQSIVNTKNNQ